MKKLTINFQTSNLIVTFSIFLGLYLLSILAFYFQGPFFLSPDDSWYHARAMLDSKNNLPTSTPEFHPFSNIVENSHYYLYHKIGGFFLSNQSLDNFYVNVLEYKIYQSLLFALLFSIISLISFQILKKINLSNLLKVLGIFLITWIVLLSTTHGTRFLIERPHIILFTFSILGLLAYLKNQKISLIALGVLTSLFYSFSLMYLIPVISYFLVDIVLKKIEKKSFTKNELLNNVTNIFWMVAGVMIGIVLHPEPYYAFWVGNFLHFKQIFTDLFGITTQMTEFIDIFAITGLHINIPFFLATLCFITIIFAYKEKIETDIQEKSTRISALFVLFLLLSFVVNRFAEYAIIFGIIVIFYGIFFINQFIKDNKDNLDLISRKMERVILIGFGAFLFWFLVILIPSRLESFTQSLNIINGFYYAQNFKNFEIDQNDIVLNGSSFATYPLLTFLNPQQKIAVGYSSIFEYEFNKELYLAKVPHAIDSETGVCRLKLCNNNSEAGLENLIEILKKQGVKHIYLDKNNAGDLKLYNYLLDNYPVEVSKQKTIGDLVMISI